MRKIVPILIFVLITSCSKEPDCGCGTVTDKSYKWGDAYFLNLNCSGKVRLDVLVSKQVYDYFTLGRGILNEPIDYPYPQENFQLNQAVVCVETLRELTRLNP